MGLLLDQHETCQVVQSTQHSLLQHDPFTWTVDGTDFLRVEDLTANAKYWDRTLDDWVNGVSQEEREQFVDAFYNILTTTNISSLEQLKENWQTHLPAMMRAAGQLDADTRSLLFRTLRTLGSISLRNARSTTPPSL